VNTLMYLLVPQKAETFLTSISNRDLLDWVIIIVVIHYVMWNLMCFKASEAQKYRTEVPLICL
jgi:hypothetical protein